jgi:outer membrane protein TolC
MRNLFCIPAMTLFFAGTLLAQGSGGLSQSGVNQAYQLPGTNAQSMTQGNAQNPFLGGISTGKPTGGVLPLSLADTIKRALTYNLGAIQSEQSVRTARSARMLALSQLLPQITTEAGDRQQQTNLDAFGFQGFPGMRKIVGPFNVFDVRAYVRQTVLDFSALNRYRAEKENLKAAELSNENARDLVVYVCANLYLQAVAGNSRIEANRAQVRTAQVLYDVAVDQKAAGVSPGLEVLRAQVELQAQQQRLIVAEDQYAKDKLALARAIGLPFGQEFTMTDGMSFAPIPEMTLDEALQRANKERPDLQSAQARVQSAEADHKAAQSGRLPTIDFSADYGDIGRRPWSSHGTFTISSIVRFPLFQGGKIQARVLAADAMLRQRESELQDLQGRIYYDIQNAFLDLKSAADRVQVAQSAIKLAKEQVQQSEDRFRAGVTNNVEVVQAQEALATASENHISSLHAHSAAKLALARAIGISDVEYEQFIRGMK